MPGDPDQVIYVWFDALDQLPQRARLRRRRAASRLVAGARPRHVIGKGIVRFHALIWPAILLSAGLPLPTTLFVHDYVTANGRKIGKSLGNAVDPSTLVERFGVDALRWWLLPRGPAASAKPTSPKTRLVETANRDLANGIGNLVQRRSRWRRRTAAAGPRSRRRLARCRRAARVDDALDAFDLRAATGASSAPVDAVNRCVEQAQPWALRGDARARQCVAPLHATTRAIVDELAPFVPDLAARARPLGPAGRRAGYGRGRTRAPSLVRVQARACSARRRAMTRRHSVSSAPSKIDSTRASTK